jgi:CAAX prenyl protease-like protein
MSSPLQRIAASPVSVRVAPFAVFLALTFAQGRLGPGSAYWLYLAKTLVGAGLIVWMRPLVEEIRWRCSWEAVAAGVGVFALWVGLDPHYPKWIGATEAWNPARDFGGWAGWFFVAVRIVGSSLVVPPLEEVFYRSFLYRYVMKPDFLGVPLASFAWTPLLVTSAIFGLAHREWLAGLLCGLAYQWLVIRKGRLGDAMTAHAITNLLLGGWVVWKGAWHFW